MIMPENLRQLRELRGIDAEAMGLLVNLSPEEISFLETDAREALDVLDLQQWALWSSHLDIPLLELIARLGLCPAGPVVPLTFRQLRDHVGRLAAEEGGLDAVEESTGWDLGDFVRNPEDGWTRKLTFFRSLGMATGCDWRGILAAYATPL